MNAVTPLKASKPFNALAAYEAERARVRKLQDCLERSLSLLSIECDRRQLRGEDVAHVRAFISRTRREAF